MNVPVPGLPGMPNAGLRSALSGVPNEIMTRSLHHGRFSMHGVDGVPNEIATRSLHHGRFTSIGGTPDGMKAYDLEYVKRYGKARTRYPVDKFITIGAAASPVQISTQPAPSFGDQFLRGLKIWSNPVEALKVLPLAIASIATSPAVSLGALTPPIAALVLVFTLVSNRKGRR